MDKIPLNKFNDKEVRYAANVELRQEDEKMILEGYALTFNNETVIGSKDWGYRELILPEAFNKTDMRKVPLKYNHAQGYLAIASTKNQSLQLIVDEKGLRFIAELIPTQANKDVYQMVKSGLLSECSFAFSIPFEDGSDWIDLDGNMPLRKIKKIDRLYDIALVDIPAYSDTEVFARSFEVLEDHRKTVEAEVREKEALARRIRIMIELNKK